MSNLDIIINNSNEIKNRIMKILEENKIEPQIIWVGGSSVKGTDHPGSDIDIYVQLPSQLKQFAHDNYQLINNTLKEKNLKEIEGIELDVIFCVENPPKVPVIPLWELQQQKIFIPQKQYLKGTNIFDLFINDPKLQQPGRVGQFMISVPGFNICDGYWNWFYKRKPEIPDNIELRSEILFGGNLESHDLVHLARGTQPFGSYLRGHVLFDIKQFKEFEPNETFPPFDHKMFFYKTKKMSYSDHEQHIVLQQYYQSHFHYPNACLLYPQLEITYRGLQTFLRSGYINESTLVDLKDHTWYWDRFIGDPTILIPAGKIINWFESLSRKEVEIRFKEFWKYGKLHLDKTKALKCFEL